MDIVRGFGASLNRNLPITHSTLLAYGSFVPLVVVRRPRVPPVLTITKILNGQETPDPIAQIMFVREVLWWIPFFCGGISQGFIHPKTTQSFFRWWSPHESIETTRSCCSMVANSETARTIRLDNGRKAAIRPRTVPLAPDWNVTVWEWDKMSETVEAYWKVKNGNGFVSTTQNSNDGLLDPFGLVSWPGSVVAAQELAKHHPDVFVNSTVLVVGAGLGLEAQALAMLGAKQVIATDVQPTTLQLLAFGAKTAGIDHIIREQEFDLLSNEPLPPCDIMVVADVMYNEHLAHKGVCRRVFEALTRRAGKPPRILVTDSQRFYGTDFVPKLNQQLVAARKEDIPTLAWKERNLERFTGSGVLIDQDQTYDVVVRVLEIGWDDTCNGMDVSREEQIN